MSDSSQYEAGYAAGWDDARIGQALPVWPGRQIRSPYWDGYHDGVTDARGTYA